MAKVTKKTVVNNVGQTLNTEGIVKAMCEASKAEGGTPISQKDAANALNLFKNVVSQAIGTGQKVQMTGFLTFAPSYRAPRQGNNVITGEKMDIPGGVVINVKAGKSLKDIAKGLDDSIVKAVQAQKADKAE